MAELIASIVLGLSLCGAFFIVGRKIPALLELQNAPKDRSLAGFRASILKNAETYLQKLPFLKDFSWQGWVEKTLSRARVMALKTDNKIEGYITALHVKEEEKKNETGGHTTGEYWSDVKKFVKTKTGLRIKPIQPRQEVETEPEIKKETITVHVENKDDIVSVLNPEDNIKDRKKKNKRRFSKKGGNW